MTRAVFILFALSLGCSRRDATVATRDPETRPVTNTSAAASTPSPSLAPAPSPSAETAPEPPPPKPEPPKPAKVMAPKELPVAEPKDWHDETASPPAAVAGGVMGGVVGGTAPAKGETPPIAVSMPPPEYPPDAKAQGKEGRVVVRLDIDEQGDVVGTKILSGSSPFKEAVLAKTPSWKFRPGRSADGKAIRSQTTATVPFRID